MSHPPSIFISYAHEDVEHVKLLVGQLEEAGYQPVWDKELLLGGMEWSKQLEREIIGADFSLACLSPQTLAKPSRFQHREIELALKLQQEQYHGFESYLIPVKLVECELPDNLRHLHCISLFESDGYAQLQRSLTKEIERRKKFSLSQPGQIGVEPVPVTVDAPMPSERWFNIVYLETRPALRRGQLPPEMEALRDWMWSQSAHGRCFCWPVGGQTELPAAGLLVLNWASETRLEDLGVIQQGRISEPPLLLIVDDDLLEKDRRPLKLERLLKARQAQSGSPTLTSLTFDELKDPGKIEKAFDELGLLKKLRRHDLKLIWDANDLDCHNLIKARGQVQLALALQKYFPQAQHAHLKSLKDGWESTRLYHLLVDEQPYLLSLLNKRDDFDRDWSGYLNARKWFKQAVLPLQAVPEVSDPLEPFRVGRSPVYPLCLAVPTPAEQEYLTLKDIYALNKDRLAFQRLLQILTPAQPLEFELKPPWGEPEKSPFVWTLELRGQIKEAIEEANQNGRPYLVLLGDWRKSEQYLSGRLGGLLPEWLSEPYRIALGPIHGQPVPQNCLINPHQPDDLKLIRCGEFNPRGRLVSDLALIERDLKLVLLFTELEANGCLELDVKQFAKWQKLETRSLELGLAFSRADVRTDSGPLKRIYELVSDVRQRARAVSDVGDKHGYHYFAALLYWTLQSLAAPQLRTTKKLLALVSAADILTKVPKP